MFISLVGNYLRPSNNSRPLNININAVVLIVIVILGIYATKITIEDHQKNAQLDLCRIYREEILTNAAIIYYTVNL